MKYLPLFTDINGQATLIVGGGAVALRKARLLIDAGACVTIVALSFDRELQDLAAAGQVTLITDQFNAEYVQQQRLVIAATDDSVTNQAVYHAAVANNILVNAVDDPKYSNFIFPAIIDRSPIMVAISSGGAAPVLVRRLREKLESLLPQHLGPLADLIGRYRDTVKATLGAVNIRRQFWEKILSSSVVSLLSQAKPDLAEQQLTEQLSEFAANQQGQQGEVYIVGGGPGDPDLLTIKALQLMQQADVVIHDGLVSDAVLNLVRRDAHRISVSKSAGFHSVPQDQINQLIIDYARQGHKVCRLKGGDPFIFGRGGEEVEDLVAAGIPFQVVPGITAAAGCAAYAGIPLTHRDHAQTVQFVTGHCRKDGKTSNSPDWQSLAKPNQTLVIYMGLINAQDIVSELVSHGRHGDTPVALIENGTSIHQRVVTGKLQDLAELISQHHIASPALIIVGEVVSLQHKLQWFGSKSIQSAYQQPLVNIDLNRNAA